MFDFGETVVRRRPIRTPDPYDPDATVPGDWDDAEELELPGAFIASSSSAAVQSATRTQVLTEKSLYCDPALDVRALDRVIAGGHTYTVDALPQADVNPFTGWQPVQEIPLTEVLG
jgi:hypothetical protein